ncbi:MAG TPA: DUF1080 domain-containing protein [Candidatus Acidoferrum sp.]|nr:DUF1080 domain-containing protein [Candidatus Acidoferrum sp.]
MHLPYHPQNQHSFVTLLSTLAALNLLGQTNPVTPPPSDASPAITPAVGTELFNGKDFTGWTFCMTQNADPMKTWSVSNGVIHCTGQPTGYIRTEKQYRNYALSVEWRFLKVAPKLDNTGILLHIQKPDNVWPRCIQVQGKHDNQGDLFLMMGAESKEHRGLDTNTPLPKRGPPNENPVGQWDTVLIICVNDNVQASVNGKFMNLTTQCTITSGFIGIQSEGGDIEIRKMTFVNPFNVPSNANRRANTNSHENP